MVMADQILIKILFITPHISSYSYSPPPHSHSPNDPTTHPFPSCIYLFSTCISGICSSIYLSMPNIAHETMDLFLPGSTFTTHMSSIPPSLFFGSIATAAGSPALAEVFRVRL